MAKAADYKISQDSSVTIGKNEQVKNIYAAGNSVTSDAAVGGDLVAAGGTVTVNGSVAQSLLAAGGNLNIAGPINQNARIAGGTIIVSSTVGQDLNIAGGSINITNSSTTTGDLLATGGTITLDGIVNGSSKISGGDVVINGTINGNADIYGQTIKIGDKAVIKGKLHYWSDKEITIPSSAQVGSVEFTRQERTRGTANLAGFLTVTKLLSLLGTILLLLALRYLFPELTKQVDNKVYADSRNTILAQLGIGLLILVATPIILLMLAVSVIGLKIALVLGLAYALFLAITSAYSPLLIGSGIMRLAKKFDQHDLNWVTILIGVIVAAILSLIPGLGWLILFLFFLATLGATSTAFYEHLVTKR